MPRLPMLASVLCVVTVAAGCGSEDGGSDPSTPPATPVATALGFGPVSVGMTLAEATTALAGTSFEQTELTPYPCTMLSGPTAGNIYVAKESGLVIGIATPDGTLTDRGVGDGSTPAQLRAAYEDDHSIEVGPFDGLVVRPTGSTNPREFLSFALDDGTVAAPYVGRNYWDDDCP